MEGIEERRVTKFAAPASPTSRIACVVVGYRETPFQEELAFQQSLANHSGGYRNLRANSVVWKDRRISMMELFNECSAEYCGINPDLSVFHLPNLAAHYLCSYLLRAGLNSKLVNFLNADITAFEELLDAQPLAIAITTTFYVDPGQIIPIVSHARRRCPTACIIVGGPYVHNLCRHADPETLEYIFNAIAADVYVDEKQGEATLLEIVRRLSDGGAVHDLAAVPNLAYRDRGGRYLRTRSEPEANGLDSYSVNWSIFDRNTVAPTALVRTARSCVYECAFCNFPLLAGSLDLASLEAVDREFRTLADLGVSNLIFVDDTFNIPLPRFKRICRLMIDRGYRFNWYSMFRCSNADREAFDLMEQSGCRAVFLGIESGSQAVLDVMNKVAKISRYEAGIAELHRRNIAMLASFIVGFPTETEESIRETIEFVERTAPTYFRAQLYYHDPTTPIQKRAQELGIAGAGYSWAHRTMTWQEACSWVEHIYRTVRSSRIFPVHGLDLESLAYLAGEGYPASFVAKFGEIASALLVESLDERVGNSAGFEDRFRKLFEGIASRRRSPLAAHEIAATGV